MAITASCCLNPPPPPSASTFPNSSNTKTSQLSWFKNEKWRSQCVLGVACMMVGLEMDIITSERTLAMAKEIEYSVVESKERPKIQRWSDKRICPPWRLNSLETIVPENLPRPSARRRWEAIGHSKDAPAPATAVRVMVKTSNNCFTM